VILIATVMARSDTLSSAWSNFKSKLPAWVISNLIFNTGTLIIPEASTMMNSWLSWKMKKLASKVMNSHRFTSICMTTITMNRYQLKTSGMSSQPCNTSMLSTQPTGSMLHSTSWTGTMTLGLARMSSSMVWMSSSRSLTCKRWMNQQSNPSTT